MEKQVFYKAALILSIFLILAGCSATKAEKLQLNVSAASSLKSVMQELKEMYEQEQPGLTVTLNYASSGALQQQIEQGAPADVFVSAGKKQIDALWDRGLVDKPQYVAGNSLVLVVPAGVQKPPANLQQLTAASFRKIAIGTPETVPAGKYARESLEHAGIWTEVSPRLVMSKDVRQVLVYVETGNADAGLVYRSDALTSGKVKTAYTVPPEFHSGIVYPAAVVRSSQQPGRAEAFVKFLLTSKAQAVFKKYGFTEAGNQ